MSMADVLTGAPSSSYTTRLSALPNGWQAIRHSVVEDGTLAVIATDVDLAGEWARIYALQERLDPPSRVSELVEAGTARLMTWDGTGWREELRVPLETPYLLIDRFADERWLVVGSRTDGMPNARLLAPDGTLLGRFMLGDGIEHAAIDSAGRVWVGWFDEGIFGNEGWRAGGEEWPPSGRGIGCFDAAGVLLPLPDFPSAAGMIADCYALTPVDEGAWACPYIDFPLLHLRPGQPARWWKSDLVGPKALAVNGSHALLAGGYGEEANRLALVSLEGVGQGEDARLLASWTLPLRRLPTPSNEWGPVWEHPTLLAGRGDTLHLVDAGVWYRWRVADVLDELKCG